MSEDETRFVLCGVHVNLERREVVATNGRILKMFTSADLPAKNPWEPDHLNVPTKSVEALKRIGAGNAWEMAVRVIKPEKKEDDETQIGLFRAGKNLYMATRLIVGHYPNYWHVVPESKERRYRLTFRESDIEHIAKTVAKLPRNPYDSKMDIVRMQISKDSVRFFTTDQASFSPECKIQAPPKEITVAYQRDYLLFALRAGYDTVEWVDEAAPVVFTLTKATEGHSGLFVMMGCKMS